MASLLSAAVFVTAVQALAFDGRPAKPTDAFIPSPTFSLPEITVPPSVHELAKRQSGQTVLVGPDNTCGYFDGRPGAVYSCNGADVSCALVTTAGMGAVACCDNTDCGLRVACIDYREYMLSSACNNACALDTFTVKCTRASAPYCGTVTFFDGIVDYYCDTNSDSTPQQLYTTYDGEKDGRTFTPVVVTLSSDTSKSVPTPDISSTSKSSTIPPGPTPDDNDNDNNNNNNGGNSNNNSSASTTNVGAIAGGVVGGVAGLALIGLGIFFLVRHNKKKKAADGANPPAAQMQQNIPPTGQVPPTGGAAGYQPPYDPHMSQQYPQQSPSPGYPPQAYYPGQDKPVGFAAVTPPTGQVVPDRNNSTSPVSQFTDNRGSFQPTSPTSTISSNWHQNQPGVYPQQQQQAAPNVPPTVHEAGGNVVGERDYNANHHGQLHELG
ncbi:hypothetical protein F5Y04DRAFT_62757 [Hypomontagnella monticulosa]|nr:hypothetical protein F5Y04DRAFT_62757 [Hypomontagnella monticulosa]